mgnify:CR=1 FL=1
MNLDYFISNFADNLVSPKEPIAHSVLASAENKLISIQGWLLIFFYTSPNFLFYYIVYKSDIDY